MKTYIKRQQHKIFKHQDMKQKEPSQKYRLGTISNTKLLAGLNRFYMAITSPSASADWFDENDDEIERLLEEKHRLHKAHQDVTSSVSKKAVYSNICEIVQIKLRNMQDSWLRKKIEEIQSFADREDMKKFHDALLKTIYDPKNSLLSADGSPLLTDKEAILKRAVKHFNSVLNRPSSINEDAIDRLALSAMFCYMNFQPSWKQAVQQLSSPGAAAIPAEGREGGGGATQGRETDRVVSLYVEQGGYPTRKGCIHNPHIQAERKSTSL